MKINKRILSFADAVSSSGEARKCVLLLRHSMRRSLKEGSFDPGLTPAGAEYALACGKEFAPWKGKVSFGASGRLRTRETAECLIRGGDLEEGISPVKVYQQIGDDAMFLSEKDLDALLGSDHVLETMQEYYASGTGPGMIPFAEFASRLTVFLTETPFEKKNAVLVTHDILIVALLLHWKVYDFCPSDWMGYIQGAALFMDEAGQWSISYIVPDVSKRETSVLFV